MQSIDITDTNLTEKQREALKLMRGNAREIMFYGGARSGKTFIWVRAIIIRALKEERSNHAIFRHRFIDCKQAVALDTFEVVLEKCFPGLTCELDRVNWFATFENGSKIWFSGLDDKKRMEKILGRQYSTIAFNECSQIGYKSTLIALTRLSEKNSLKKRAYYDENPPSKGHWTYKKFIEYTEPITFEPLARSKYESILMNPADNLCNISFEYMTILDSLPHEEKARFKYGLFQDTVSGAVYQKQMNDLAIDGRVIDITPTPEFPVAFAFDIGTRDATSVWVCQFLKDRILFLDYYENSFEPFMHYLNVLKDKGYMPRALYLPHDAKNRSWVTGKSTREVVAGVGSREGYITHVLPQLAIWDGINACRALFPICYFDTKCAKGLGSLRNYRVEYRDALGTFSEPVHDWSSHGADAFRYACTAYSIACNKSFDTRALDIDMQGLDFLNGHAKDDYNNDINIERQSQLCAAVPGAASASRPCFSFNYILERIKRRQKED